MKILKLTYQNINALQGEHEVDFTQTCFQKGIFAITGATGAGKSSLLDAICVALYSQTPRLGSAVDALISQGSSNSFSEVTFQHNNKIYISKFSQIRKENRVQKEMKLYLENKLLIEGVSKVTQQIEQLTGLNFKQFTYTILLAQGLFDTFLKATIEERATILEKMTDTTNYSKISQEVFHRAEKELKELNRVGLKLKNLTLLKRDERVELLREKNILEHEKSSFNLDKIVHQLNQRIYFDELSKKNEHYQKEIEGLQQQLIPMQVIQKSYQDFIYFVQEEKVKIDNAKLLDREIEFTNKNFERLNQEIQQKEREILFFDAKIEKIQEGVSELKVQQTLIKKDLDSYPQGEHLRQNFTLIASKFDELQKSKKALQAIKLEKGEDISEEPILKIIKELKEKIIHLEKSIKEKNIEKIEQQYIILKTNIVKLMRKEDIEKSQTDAFNSKKQILKILNGLKEKNILLKNEQKSIKEITVQLQEKQLLEQQIINYEEDRKHLKAEHPCPLCGSLEHPLFKVKPQPNQTKKILFEKEERLKKTELYHHNNEKEMVKLQSNLEQIELKLTHQKKELMGLRETNGNLIELKNNQRVIEEKLHAVKYQKEELTATKSKLQNSEKELAQLRLQVQKNHMQKKREKIIQSDIQELNYFLIKSLREYSIELDNHSLIILEKMKQEFEQKSKQLILLNQEIGPMEGQRIEIQSKKTYLEESLNSHKKRASIQKCDLLMLKQKRYSTLENKNITDYTIELNSEEYELKKKLDAFNDLKKEFNNKRAVYFSTMEELESKQKLKLIDLEKLKKHKLEVELQINTLQQKLYSINHRLNIDDENIKKFEKEQHTLEEQTHISNKWNQLNELIGSVDGSKYRVFAQSLTLELLISLANEYLQQLNNRYLLTVSKENKLELNIIDLYQNRHQRNVHTLSGGESFIISLALALGLSDMVSDKLEINTLFLDEGFETLDTESLKIVLSTLETLNVNNRVIGIVSHTSALKNKIGTQIHFDKQENGMSLMSIIEDR